MTKAQLAIAAFVAASLAVVPLAAEAKHHKKHHESTSSQTTGANMKSGTSANPSSQGNGGPGTNQAGSMSK
jgi:hypothetical protein